MEVKSIKRHIAQSMFRSVIVSREERSILISTEWTSRPQLSEGTCRRENIRGQNANCQPAPPPNLTSFHLHTHDTLPTQSCDRMRQLCTTYHIRIRLWPPLMVIRRRSARVLLKLMIRPPGFVLHASVSPLRGGQPWREIIPGNWSSAV